MSKQSTPVFALTVIAAEALTAARFVTPTGAVPSSGGNTLGVTLSDAASGALAPVGVPQHRRQLRGMEARREVTDDAHGDQERRKFAHGGRGIVGGPTHGERTMS